MKKKKKREHPDVEPGDQKIIDSINRRHFGKKKKRDSPVMCANCNKHMKKLAKPYTKKDEGIGEYLVTHKCDCGCIHGTKEMKVIEHA